jgi:predicted nucleic acid-binding Zn ribbon protein
MTDDNQYRWVHCPVCGVPLPLGFSAEQCCEHTTTADELARKQRVVDAIGVFMAKPAKPLIPRRWRRPGFR